VEVVFHQNPAMSRTFSHQRTHSTRIHPAALSFPVLHLMTTVSTHLREEIFQ
jgi:hypothetical protein